MTDRWRSGRLHTASVLLLIGCLAGSVLLPSVNAVTLAKPKEGRYLTPAEETLPGDKGEVGTSTESSSEELLPKGWGAAPRQPDDGGEVWGQRVGRKLRLPEGPVVGSTTETSVTNAAIGAATVTTETSVPPPPIRTTTEDYEAMMEEQDALEETFVNHTCYGKHIRFDVTDLRHLRKCTTVAGNVVMVFLNFRNNTALLNSYSFPKLIEITGYLLIHRVRHAPSMSHMFPNLRVIRGAQLVHKYALVIVENIELQEIAFPSLTTISHGYAIIRDNVNLCGMDAINWDRITVDKPGEEVGSHNVISVSRPKHCPRQLECTKCPERYCWQEGLCQQFESGLNVDGNMRCHKDCIGGCVNDTSAGCFRCRGLHINGTCVDECPEHLFRNDFIYGCSDADGCWFYNAIPLHGACYPECPAGYGHIVQPRLPMDMVNCHKCPDGRCLRVCRSGPVRWLTDLEQFRHCQVINGSVLLQLHDTHQDQRPSLLRHFREVEQILGTLEVHRSTMLTDLSFFKRLHLIDPLQSELLNGRYAVKIWDNRALTRLWDWSEHPAWNVTRGEVGIMDNPKLCVRTIRESVTGQQLVVGERDALSSMNMEEIKSNGYYGVCESRDFETRITHITADTATVEWAPFVPPEGQSVFGYYVFHTEAALQDANRDAGLDVCASKHWHSRLLPTRSDGTLIEADPAARQYANWLTYNVTGLLQHQQYAYYVQVDVRRTNETSAQDIVQGLSTIAYFTTGNRIPLPPFVYTQSKTNTSITLRWFHPAWDTNRYVELYVVDVYRLPDNLTRIRLERDYCKFPKVITPPRISASPAFNETVYKCCERRKQTPRFLTAHIGLDGDPDACGPDDHECRHDAEYHIMRSNDTYYTHNSARLEAIRAEELPYLQQPLPAHSPFNYAPQKRYIAIPHLDRSFVSSSKVSNYTPYATIANLKPFERYAIRVFACTFQSQCGTFFQHFERTLRTPNADDTAVTVELHDALENQLNLRVTSPQRPTGGAVLSWEFEMYEDRRLQRTWCVADERTLDWSPSFVISAPLDVDLRFRVRAITLGSNGNWAEAFYKANDSTLKTHSVLIVIFLSFLAICVAAAAFFLVYSIYQYFDRMFRNNERDIELLNLRSVSQETVVSTLSSASETAFNIAPRPPPDQGPPPDPRPPPAPYDEVNRAAGEGTSAQANNAPGPSGAVHREVNRAAGEGTSAQANNVSAAFYREVNRAAGEGTSAQANTASAAFYREVNQAAGEGTSAQANNAPGPSAPFYREVNRAAGEGTSAQANWAPGRNTDPGVQDSDAEHEPMPNIDLEAGRPHMVQQPANVVAPERPPRTQDEQHDDITGRYDRVAFQAVASGYSAGSERARLIACDNFGRYAPDSSDDD